MTKQIYINLPVTDLERSTKFYQALGFTINTDFSNESASSMMWSEDIVFMLLSNDFYTKFTSKTIPDINSTSSHLIALTMESVEAVQQFADIAQANGGSWFEAEPNKGLDFMFTLEVSDPDGHTMEPFFMDITKFTKN
jgi:uncharacterized protein